MSQSPQRSSFEPSAPDAATLVSSMTLKGTKETRAAEALAMKDEQLKILGGQNTQLLASLNEMDDEISKLKLNQLRLDEENQSLRDQNFELENKARAAETTLLKAQTGIEERATQIKVLNDHNTELLRLLEHEEAQTSALSSKTSTLASELETLQTRYASLLSSAKTHEEIATRATREGQLRAEELRLLRNESDQLRACNIELKMKTEVELESLHEQLRLRKEKQYQLLEKMQQLEELKRQSEDQLAALEDKMRKLHVRNQELETQVQLEAKAKRAQIDANKQFFTENGNLLRDKQELQTRFDKAEQERSRMEAENRDSADQLREMAEKVFQLLERLKLAELGKTNAIDGLKQKEIELLTMKKKNARLLKEGTQEGKARVKSELDKKVLLEQLQALKKHNAQLSLRCSDEVKAKLKEADERKQLEEKLKIMNSRIAFLLNKMQADEEAKIVSKENTKKLQAQVTTLQEKGAEVAHKLHSTAESNRVVTEALRYKQDQLDAQVIKFEAMQKKMAEMALAMEQSGVPMTIGDGDKPHERPQRGDQEMTHPEDAAAAANGRFFVECRPSHGGLLLIKAKRNNFTPKAQQQSIDFLEHMNINSFLKRAQKSLNTKQLLVEKIAALLTTIVTCQDAVSEIKEQNEAKNERMTHLSRKIHWMQERLTIEEDAKRKMLLRYVHEVKSRAVLASNNSSDHEILSSGGNLRLPESGIGDEEVHAIAALVRNATSLFELQLRGNAISSEGARAIAAVLGMSSCRLRHVDLRNNHIGRDGIKVLAEALERNERIKHVYVHVSGKIEALGTTSRAPQNASVNAQISNAATFGTSDSSQALLINVETVCVVDVRDQNKIDSNEISLNLCTDIANDPRITAGAAVSGSSLKLKLTGITGDLGSSKSSNVDRGSKNLFLRRPLSSAALKRQRERFALDRKKRQDEVKRQARKEADWAGRSGGLESSPLCNKKLPPIATSATDTKGVTRTSSAPILSKNEDCKTDSQTADDPAES
ncbi:Leucine-rich repeat, ribonuclease inhibitor subtype [Plasmopara halstedii]|uniref:Leucine-rich repeat, ribonuclease inhibitor subtype n=1 Tax=Plasmopara halstedii TaxID=4781 RepID=A0A0P1AQ66_PLAHL|nr:Leucine-rich repeat, ribonuclease inhibitor subtype [Plasmopara halstedii]CEG43669.1 Leucine-rich repeat, ribonuclease inhibitor subtype [Plasmopara halstedii]|eukprot:XP_024580038.1 Leucine-rich repeat, ribonuclease inhibitor subtype [Plasmopara halstedii]